MRRSLEAKSIKSAQRVFEVLEYFDARHPDASVMDIARRYGYPQSSASELLSYMESLGYLRRGANRRTYQPSIRVAMLGAWAQPRLMREGRLLPMMDELAKETGAAAVLAGNSGVRLQCLHVVPGSARAAAPAQGALLPLLRSAAGHALLARCDRELVRKYVHRLNAEAERGEDRVAFDTLSAQLNAVEKHGRARVEDDTGLSIAITLPHGDPGEPLALALHAPRGTDEGALLRRLQNAVARHLGLVGMASPTERRFDSLRASA